MTKYEPDAESHTVYVRVNPEMSLAHPNIRYAKPKSDEVYRLYIGGDIKVRKMNSGVMQIATEGNDWMEV